MGTLDRRFQVVFNGEIYNYPDLKKEYEAKGIKFRTTTDTELLLEMYREEGILFVRRLRGMFAFAIHDTELRRTWLVRDPLGIKPLYYRFGEGKIDFASEFRALIDPSRESLEADPIAVASFLTLGYVVEPRTMVQEVKSLEAGQMIEISRDGPPKFSHFSSVQSEMNIAVSTPGDRPHGAVLAALRDSVHAHTLSDVPVALFLSAGLDSTMLASLMSGEIELRKRFGLHAITVGFDDFKNTENDEVPLASLVARQLGFEHHVFRIQNDEFESLRENFLDAMDLPTIDGPNTFLVSHAARNFGFKVALSGLGGDEIFGGYPSFRDVPRVRRLANGVPFAPTVGKSLRMVAGRAISRITSPKYASLLELGGSYGGAYYIRRGLFMPWELPKAMGRDRAESAWKDLDLIATMNSVLPQNASDSENISALELSFYTRNQLLRDSDWAGMRHGIEIRVPLLDLPFLRETWQRRLLANKGVRDWRRALAAELPTPLPSEILKRPKTGFSFPVRERFLVGSEHLRDQRGLRGWSLLVLREYLTRNRLEAKWLKF